MLEDPHEEMFARDQVGVFIISLFAGLMIDVY